MISKRHSITYKLFIPWCIGFLLFSMSLILIDSIGIKVIVNERLKERALDTIEGLTVAIEPKVTTPNIIRITNSIGSNKNVAFIAIVRQSNGMVMASNFNSIRGKYIAHVLKTEFGQYFPNSADSQNISFSGNTQDTFKFMKKIYLKLNTNLPAEPLAVYLALDTSYEQHELSNQFNTLIISLIAIFSSISCWLFFIIRRNILIPLKAFNQHVSQSAILSEHALKTFDVKDELGSLAIAYNQLMNTLEEKSSELTREKELSEAASKAKSEFLAVMTHELRTPLNGIIGCNELVQDTPLNPDQKNLIKLSRQSAKQLLAIVNDILDISKIESGKMTLDLVEVDIIDTTFGAVESFRLQSDKKNIQLTFENTLASKHRVLIDDTRYRQILVNLLSNAFKFTDEGRITVVLKQDRELSDQLWIEVIDTGIGLTADQQKHIFDKFTQADSSTTRKYGGTGLGLPICAKLVEMIGGQLQVSSEVGRGSCFYFNLTAKPASAEAPPADASDNLDIPIAFTDVKVLIVDDTRFNLVVAERFFEREDVTIELASSGEEALEKCQNTFYHLILMDCLMPDIDGYECSRRLRAMQNDNRSYIVGFTASALTETERECYQAGMDSFVVKPIVRTSVDKVYQLLYHYLSTQK
ncbi:ATP-binding protein [Vibrio profundum]|uniref:ATP-binding protein n=1 Tax=Vibrio profundum TaxID=2910247 RepID=UPI003D0FA590